MTDTHAESSGTDPDRAVDRATDRLEAGVQQLHVPEPRTDRETLLLRAGVAIVVLGWLCIGLGWWGASGTANLAEQIPYLISGGLFGIALVVAGTGLVMRYSLARLFRYWLARLVAEHALQTDRTVDALGRIETALGPRQ
jgi:hypothetical protein